MKIRAYTLVEIIISMAITSILVTIIYGVFMMVNTYFEIVRDHVDISIESTAFQNQLSKDYLNADSSEVSDGVLYLYHAPKSIKWYSDTATGLIRSLDRLNTTFKISNTYFELTKTSGKEYLTIYWKSSKGIDFYYVCEKELGIQDYIN